jgi:type IV pilus assembly protein PilW
MKPLHPSPRHHFSSFHSFQSGATLIELMVGITIGLLTVAVATGALMVSRTVSGTVTDASQLQQQASYAFRVLGQQLRQAGSMRLNLAANKAEGETIDPADVVAFAPDQNMQPAFPGGPASTPAVSGKDTPSGSEYALSAAYQNYAEKSFTASADISFFRDCSGAGSSPASTPIIQSNFVLKSGELYCGAQPVLRNVADFQVRYLVQSDAAVGTPKIQAASAAAASANWFQVFGVEVCLVLYGDEVIDMPAGSEYVGCDGKKVNMSSSGSLDSSRKNRMHMSFRNVYQLRSQGLTG